MSSVYSTRFAAARVDGSGGGSLYTVPAGKVAIVRDISFTPIGGDLTTGYYLFVRTPAGDCVLWGPPARDAHTTALWTGRQVLEAGDQLRYVGTGVQTDYLVSGYLLDAP